MAVGDGDEKDSTHRCLRPVEMANMIYAQCMVNISAEQIFDAMMGFYGRGKVLEYPK